jgi:glycosyltransferase involved in cell wall biosynthesis
MNPKVPVAPIHVVVCWSAISGYMASCWRALAARPGIDLHVIAHRRGGGAFAESLLAGLSHQLLDPQEADNRSLITGLVAERRPDVVAMTGWWLDAYRSLVRDRRLADAKFIMGVDTPWRHEGQFLTRFRYWLTLRHIDHFFVPGERSWQYVKRLGAAPSRISRGMYGVDVTAWEKCIPARAAGPWPRRFLFLGRYAEEKALDVLVDAYARYRGLVADPWLLTCCGTGPFASLLRGRPGIEDQGFVQPTDLAAVFAASGAMVLPSRFDPWPLALVEAAAAGLPIVCTDACGSAVEVVRPLYNGLVVPSESPDDLARALAEVTAREAEMPAWGERANQFARAYSAELWAERWAGVIHHLVS